MESLEFIPRLPFTAFLVGCSGSGKTKFYENLLLNWEKIFQVPIGKLIIVYSYYQNAYDNLQQFFGDKCQLATDLSEDMLDTSNVNSESCSVLVVDDLAWKLAENELLVQCFIGISHHRNLNVLFVTQNLFASRSPSYLTMQRNAKLIFLFRLPRDMTSVRVLGRQIYPDKNGSQILSQAYDLAMEDFARNNSSAPCFGYLFVDLQISCPNSYRLRSGLLPWEPRMLYYVLN